MIDKTSESEGMGFQILSAKNPSDESNNKENIKNDNVMDNENKKKEGDTLDKTVKVILDDNQLKFLKFELGLSQGIAFGFGLLIVFIIFKFISFILLSMEMQLFI